MSVNIVVLKELDNRLLSRKQIDFKIIHQQMPTPSRAEVRSKLAAQLNVNPKAIIIHKLDGRFGQGITVGFAKIYDSPEKVEEIEFKYLIKRNQPKEQKAE